MTQRAVYDLQRIGAHAILDGLSGDLTIHESVVEQDDTLSAAASVAIAAAVDITEQDDTPARTLARASADFYYGARVIELPELEDDEDDLLVLVASLVTSGCLDDSHRRMPR